METNGIQQRTMQRKIKITKTIHASGDISLVRCGKPTNPHASHVQVGAACP
jgi:hypothetical protein